MTETQIAVPQEVPQKDGSIYLVFSHGMRGVRAAVKEWLKSHEGYVEDTSVPCDGQSHAYVMRPI